MINPDDPHAETVRKAQKALVNGQNREASEIAQSILDISPHHQDALYIKAVSARYLADFEGANFPLIH